MMCLSGSNFKKLANRVIILTCSSTFLATMKENLPVLSHMEQNVSHLLSLAFFDVVIAISSKEHLADNLLQCCRQLINLTVKLL